MYSAMNKKLVLVLVPLLVAVHALDVPRPCNTICEPIRQLKDRCETDLPGDDDSDERRLESQCFCSNRSFDVGRILPLCASCMHQARSSGDREDNDTNEVDDTMSRCRLSSTTYSQAATSLAQGIIVSASPLTNTNQLSTASGGVTRTSTVSGGSSTTSSASTSSGISAAGRASSSAASGPRPLGGVSGAGVVCVAGSLLAGALLMMRG